MNQTIFSLLAPSLTAEAKRAGFQAASRALKEIAQHPDPAIAAALHELLARLDHTEKDLAKSCEIAFAILQLWALQTRATQPERVMEVAQALAATHPFSDRVGNDIRLMANRLVGYAQGLNDEE